MSAPLLELENVTIKVGGYVNPVGSKGEVAISDISLSPD